MEGPDGPLGKRRLREPSGAAVAARPAPIPGLRNLELGDLLTLKSSELREFALEDFLGLMEQLGISTAGIESRTQALTQLMNNAYDLGDVE